MRYLLSFLLILGFCSFSIAQESDREFAEFYFKNKEYSKAQLYFVKLYEEQPGIYYYNRLLDCYLETENWEEAVELVKKQIRSNNNAFSEYFDLALLYRRLKDEKRFEKSIEKGLSSVPNNRGQISTVGRKLEDAALYQVAQVLYEIAQEKNLGYAFNLELAGLYGVQGQTKKMIAAYINLVAENPAYASSVQSALIRYLDFTQDEEQAENLKVGLLEAIQTYPENRNIAELLIWFYYQQKKFGPAFAQVRALDLRYKENGRRVLEFAQLAARNKEFYAAYQAYDYLEKQYPEEGIRTQVLMQKAKMAYLELSESAVPDTQTINQVRDAFDAAISEIGKNVNSASLLIDYADYTLKYGAGPNAAKELLKEVIDIPSLYKKVQALAKLRLADILLIQGDIWNAALLYGQVDKDFKEDELGAEARLRNAKVAFYTGDFEWSQAQLDVLKSGTSELISNDAIELSLLIGNNFNLDTVTEPLELYAAADLAVLQRKYGEASNLLDSLAGKYPNHSLSDEILMVRYKMAMQQKNFDLAASFLQQIIEEYPFDLLGDNAIYLLAELYNKQLKDKEKAAGLYEKLIKDYPGSLFIIDARKKFRTLRGDKYFEG